MSDSDWRSEVNLDSLDQTYQVTFLPAKSDSDVVSCLQLIPSPWKQCKQNMMSLSLLAGRTVV